MGNSGVGNFAVWAILEWAILEWAILEWAILEWAILEWAILEWAILEWAILEWAILEWAILHRHHISQMSLLPKIRFLGLTDLSLAALLTTTAAAVAIALAAAAAAAAAAASIRGLLLLLLPLLTTMTTEGGTISSPELPGQRERPAPTPGSSPTQKSRRSRETPPQTSRQQRQVLQQLKRLLLLQSSRSHRWSRIPSPARPGRHKSKRELRRTGAGLKEIVFPVPKIGRSEGGGCWRRSYANLSSVGGKPRETFGSFRRLLRRRSLTSTGRSCPAC